MNILSKTTFAVGVFFAAGITAGTVQEITVPKGHIALHDNQPLMSRCTRVEFEWDYKDGKVIFKGYDDTRESENNSNQYPSEPNDPPDSRDHADRDQSDRDHK